MRAVQVVHRGVRMQSRAEGWFAEQLDAAGIGWCYEPIFPVPSGAAAEAFRYRADFLVPGFWFPAPGVHSPAIFVIDIKGRSEDINALGANTAIHQSVVALSPATIIAVIRPQWDNRTKTYGPLPDAPAAGWSATWPAWNALQFAPGQGGLAVLPKPAAQA